MGSLQYDSNRFDALGVGLVARCAYYVERRDAKEDPELIADLQKHGFVDRGGKGSHRNFVHPRVTRPVTLSGAPGQDAKKYQERAVRAAIVEATS